MKLVIWKSSFFPIIGINVPGKNLSSAISFFFMNALIFLGYSSPFQHKRQFSSALFTAGSDDKFYITQVVIIGRARGASTTQPGACLFSLWISRCVHTLLFILIFYIFAHCYPFFACLLFKGFSNYHVSMNIIINFTFYTFSFISLLFILTFTFHLSLSHCHYCTLHWIHFWD